MPPTAAPWAWCLSAAAHLVAAAALAVALGPRTPPPAGPPALDTRAPEPRGVTVRLLDAAPPPNPNPRPLPPVPVAGLPAARPVVPEVAAPPTPVRAVAFRTPDALHGDAPEPAAPPAGVTADCRTVVYLLDTSSSMGPGGRLGSACAALLAHARRLPPGVRYKVVVYDSKPTVLRFAGGDWRDATAAARGDLAGQLTRLRAEGGSDHERAVNLALGGKPDLVCWFSDAARHLPGNVRAVPFGVRASR